MGKKKRAAAEGEKSSLTKKKEKEIQTAIDQSCGGGVRKVGLCQNHVTGEEKSQDKCWDERKLGLIHKEEKERSWRTLNEHREGSPRTPGAGGVGEREQKSPGLSW